MYYSGINIDCRNFFVIATFFAVIPSGAVEVFGEEKRNKAQSLKEVMLALLTLQVPKQWTFLILIFHYEEF